MQEYKGGQKSPDVTEGDGRITAISRAAVIINPQAKVVPVRLSLRHARFSAAPGDVRIRYAEYFSLGHGFLQRDERVKVKVKVKKKPGKGKEKVMLQKR